MATFQHLVCFPCRKGFKKRTRLSSPALCPQCGMAMVRMGPAFRAPRHGDAKEWRKVEALRRSGVGYGGRHDRDRRELVPTRLRDVPEFVSASRVKSAGQRSIDRSKKPTKSAVPPVLRFLPGAGAAPFARTSSKRIIVGDGPGVDVPLDCTLGGWAVLAWKPGPALFLVKANLRKHTTINGAAPKILPQRLHPYDVLRIGSGRAVLDW